jgi:glucose-1-phosphate adenylyltransferase
MKKAAEVLAIVLAGGEGRRLAPLTRQTAKPAVPFHTDLRLIDFALSNLYNSGVGRVKVLMQYQPDSVLQHLRERWCGPWSTSRCTVDPVVGGEGELARFAGTADAVYQVRHAIREARPDVVAVFSADHVYRMDVRPMVERHLQSGADATVSAIPVPCEAARAFGVMEVDRTGRIRRFAEKPAQPSPMPGRPGFALASMGNYLFEPRFLLQALEACHAEGGTDFGNHLLPALVLSHRLMAYDFTQDAIDGLAEECDPHYWRDVGTLDAYFTAHMDTMAEPGGRPCFDVAASSWPIRSGGAIEAGPRSWGLDRYRRFLPASSRAQVEQSVLRRGVHVGERSEVFRCILGEGVEVGAGCRLRRVIVEAGTRLPAGFKAGFDAESDRARFPVSAGGVVVIPRGHFETVAPGSRQHGHAGVLLESS